MSDEEVTSKIFENMKKGFNLKDKEEKTKSKEDTFSVSNSLEKMLGKKEDKKVKIKKGKDKRQGMNKGALKTGIQNINVKENKVKNNVGNIDVTSALDKMLGKKKK
jgi:hypothetical protein